MSCFMNVRISSVLMQPHASRAILQYAFKSATCFGKHSYLQTKHTQIPNGKFIFYHTGVAILC